MLLIRKHFLSLFCGSPRVMSDARLPNRKETFLLRFISVGYVWPHEENIRIMTNQYLYCFICHDCLNNDKIDNNDNGQNNNLRTQ